jgi:hypothetical protein
MHTPHRNLNGIDETRARPQFGRERTRLQDLRPTRGVDQSDDLVLQERRIARPEDVQPVDRSGELRFPEAVVMIKVVHGGDQGMTAN